ncbi:hypothetical protein JOM56_015066 [Amanita muscaria]
MHISRKEARYQLIQNITKATTVIMCDSDESSIHKMIMIPKRLHVSGLSQIKVLVKTYRSYHLICQKSVEDQILDRIRRKLFLLHILNEKNDAQEEEKDFWGSPQALCFWRPPILSSSEISSANLMVRVSLFVSGVTRMPFAKSAGVFQLLRAKSKCLRVRCSSSHHPFTLIHYLSILSWHTPSPTKLL